ncbi:Heat-labile enterotoxin IIB, A chain [Moelleriella libera RCEF 2490]|uniref:Heat-labile enterotoxin IIB, A chain n=1 Tax=Moelleriella libera RCEF 2490 TaxID=1081109 RepID=A0A166PGM9_9HYPO|nr:Heat-labile enterotoxin IIB, A chain [Moelleriella libera RCEF 2490]
MQNTVEQQAAKPNPITNTKTIRQHEVMATKRWLLVVFSAAIFLLVRMGDEAAASFSLFSSRDGVQTVFRGDLRSPDQIKSMGGFFPPRDSDIFRRGGGALTELELERQCSLFYHHTGATARYTKYVSTTSNPRFAEQSAEFFHKTRQEQGAFGYIYRISADPKMVDVVRSLGEEHMHPEYVRQAEHAVVGGIPFRQIEGWYKIRDMGGPEIKRLRSGERLDALFHENPDFDTRYLAMRGSGAQPQLAGFGERNSLGQRARERAPWRRFRDGRVRDRLEEFRRRVVAPDVAAAQTDFVVDEMPVFVTTDALGARDLIGALDLEELEEGITVEFLPENTNGQQTPLVSQPTAAEVAEATQIEAVLDSRTSQNQSSHVSVLGEVMPWLSIVK